MPGGVTLRAVRIVLILIALITVGAFYNLGTTPPPPEAAEQVVVAQAAETAVTTTTAVTATTSLDARCSTGESAPTGRIVGDPVGVEEGIGLDLDCLVDSIPSGTTVTIASSEAVARLCAPLPDAAEGCWNGSRVVIPVDAWMAGEADFFDRLSELTPQD